MDWSEIFFQGWAGIVRTLVAGTLAYAFLVLALRGAGKRTLAKLNAFDLVVTVAFGSVLASILLSEGVALAQGVPPADLETVAREAGHGSLEGLEAVILESDGAFSVLAGGR